MVFDCLLMVFDGPRSLHVWAHNHVPFAFEHLIQWRRFWLESGHPLSHEQDIWRPPRLAINPDQIGIIHFSGDAKLWDLCLEKQELGNTGMEHGRRAVQQVISEKWDDTGTFVEKWLKQEMMKTGDDEVPVAEDDLTQLHGDMQEILKRTATMATVAWRECAEDLLLKGPSWLLEFLKKGPCVPSGCFQIGDKVEVQWCPSGEDKDTWFPGQVVSVSKNQEHVVRFDHAAAWGDTERGIKLERLRQHPLSPRAYGYDCAQS
jgi:hypothetical protein